MKNVVAPESPIVVVSGLPRSGTSMLMRMLAAGGMPILTDAARRADADNPHGYFEYEPAKRLREDPSWLAEARGKAVKIISFLVRDLPPTWTYRVIFVQRDLDEVLASQQAMLARRAASGAIAASAGDPEKVAADNVRLKDAYRKHLGAVRAWLSVCPNLRVVDVEHLAALTQPKAVAEKVNGFLGGALDVSRMADAVEAALYRQRR